METTRHFVASVFVVNDGAVALHDHKKLDFWLPAGGHIDPKELPHEAAIRECEEEMGITPTLLSPGKSITGDWVNDVPEPAEVAVEDIDVKDGDVYHKHVDLMYFAKAGTREITPQQTDEAGAEAWKWFTKEDLARHEDDERFPGSVIQPAKDAIDIAETVTE